MTNSAINQSVDKIPKERDMPKCNIIFMHLTLKGGLQTSQI